MAGVLPSEGDGIWHSKDHTGCSSICCTAGGPGRFRSIPHCFMARPPTMSDLSIVQVGESR